MNTLRVERYGHTRFWAVKEADDTLLCVCVYRRGALAVLQRLQAYDQAGGEREPSAVGRETPAPQGQAR